MNNRRNYYRILHIQPDAPDLLIKASYRTLMQKLKMHPDLGGSHWNAALVNEAYAVLSNPVKRHHYDRKLLEVLSQSRFHKEEIAKDKNGVYSNSSNPSQQQLISHYCPFCKTPYQPDQQYLRSSVCFECRSPLQSNKEGELVENHHRLLERKAIEAVVSYYDYWPQSPALGKIRDISPKGVCFTVNHMINTQSILKLECVRFQAIVEVVHCDFKAQDRDLPYAIGAEFLTVHFEQPKGGFLSVEV
jgi:hypothetical protein